MPPGFLSSSTCGRPGAGPAAWSALRSSNWPVTWQGRPRISQRFAAQAIPTLLVLRRGQVTARQTGAAPLAALRTWVDNALAGTGTAD